MNAVKQFCRGLAAHGFLPRSRMNPFKLAIILLCHPLEAFDILKRERETRIRLWPAVLLVLLAFLAGYSYLFLVSFQLREKALSEINPGFEFAIVAIPYLAWVTASFCMTSILNGESKIQEIVMATAYCLIPYIVFMPLLGLLSHVLSFSEAGVYQLLRQVVFLWMLILVFLSLMRLNDYGFWRAVLMTLLSVLFMVLILAAVVLLIALTIQLGSFFSDIANEVDLKYFY